MDRFAWKVGDLVPAASPIGYENAARIAREVTLGRSPEREDAPDEAAFRSRVAARVEEISARGGVVEIPGE